MVRVLYVLKNSEQMMVNKSYPGIATHFKTAETQIASVGIPPKL